MNDRFDFDLVYLFAAIVGMFGFAFAADRKWYRPGPTSAMAYLLGGVATAALCWMAGVPWFSGDSAGFVVGGVIFVAALFNRDDEERCTRRPFLVGLAVGILLGNLIDSIR